MTGAGGIRRFNFAACWAGKGKPNKDAITAALLAFRVSMDSFNPGGITNSPTCFTTALFISITLAVDVARYQ